MYLIEYMCGKGGGRCTSDSGNISVSSVCEFESQPSLASVWMDGSHNVNRLWDNRWLSIGIACFGCMCQNRSVDCYFSCRIMRIFHVDFVFLYITIISGQ